MTTIDQILATVAYVPNRGKNLRSRLGYIGTLHPKEEENVFIFYIFILTKSEQMTNPLSNKGVNKYLQISLLNSSVC